MVENAAETAGECARGRGWRRWKIGRHFDLQRRRSVGKPCRVSQARRLQWPRIIAISVFSIARASAAS
jgi:hypothetical protein